MAIQIKLIFTCVCFKFMSINMWELWWTKIRKWDEALP